MTKPWVLSYPFSAQRRLLSDWADAQADLSLRWAHMSFCWFCHVAAQMYILTIVGEYASFEISKTVKMHVEFKYVLKRRSFENKHIT